MLRPSYSELMDIMNNDEKYDNQISSPYTIVIATAKRARQIIDANITDKAVSTAVKEIYEGKISVKYRDDVIIEERAQSTNTQKREQLFITEI